MKPNEAKLAFSRTMTDMEGGFITSSICHNYGIMNGCDEGCPALLAGDCDVPNEAIECCDVTDEEKTEILVMYREQEALPASPKMGPSRTELVKVLREAKHFYEEDYVNIRYPSDRFGKFLRSLKSVCEKLEEK